MSPSCEVLPVTSYSCTGKVPRKGKESIQQMSEITFEEHVVGQTKKRKFHLLEDFNPHPESLRGTVKDLLPSLLDKVRGKGLCISIQVHDIGAMKTLRSQPPLTFGCKSNKANNRRVQVVSEEKAREIEQATHEQRNSQLWFNVRRHRLTASCFGDILRRKPDTPPDSSVKSFTSAATEWGIANEKAAIYARK